MRARPFDRARYRRLARSRARGLGARRVQPSNATSPPRWRSHG